MEQLCRCLTLALTSLVLGQTLAACAAPGAPPDPDDSWEVVALRTTTVLEGEPARLCDLGARQCVPLETWEAIQAPALVETGRGARATLQVGPKVTITIDERSQVAIEEQPYRSLVVRAGRLTLRVEGEAEAPLAESLVVQVADREARIDPTEPTVLAIAAERADRGAVTVIRGRVTLRGTAGDRTELATGQSARVVSGHPVDSRAAFLGSLAPVEALPPEAPTDEVPTAAPRGLGRMTARVPGTEAVIGGVRLVSHHVRATVEDGFARTEIVEEFHNDTSQVLEGRYVFPLPPDASISRLALWVGDELVEGEMLERERAARIFKGIVDDTVRPRDPALLEWVRGSEFSLKIFPILPGKSRRVLLAYNQALPVDGSRLCYRYPLSLGSDRATQIDDFSIQVTAKDHRGAPVDVRTPLYPAEIERRGDEVEARFEAKAFGPTADFVLSFQSADAAATRVAVYRPAATDDVELVERSEGADESAYVAVRLRASLPDDAPTPTFQRRDRAFVIDVSHSQSRESFQTQLAVSLGLLQRMHPDERFVVLACDAACESYPTAGLALARQEAIDGARAWLNERRLGGASDVAGALVAASRRLEPDGAGQLVFLGDGAATAGELSATTIAQRVNPELERRAIDLRLLGVGRSVDGQTMNALAASLGGSYEPIAPNVAPSVLVEGLAMALRAPVVTRPELELPAHLTAVYPKQLPNVRLGQEVIVLAKLGANQGGEVVLRGKLEGRPYKTASTLGTTQLLNSQNPLVPRLWAERRIADLQRSHDEEAVRETIALSQQHHVMSRYTALLVLENERMYREFGIRRTQGADTKDGGTGQRRGRQTLNRYGIAGPADSPDPHVARLRALREAAEFGIIGALDVGASGDPEALTAPWGRDDSLGVDPLSAKGNMWGDRLGNADGAGGLGLSGIGSGGGGGRGEGIGLGSMGTIGRGAGTGTGQGFGSGQGRLGRGSRARPPRVRMGATNVSGRLPPEVIQRIVRQNFGRFRLCYENGLRNNPSLQGRVSVRFVIGRDGGVSNVGGSGDIPDAGVISCVTRAFYGLSFPQPEGGIVTVSYPIVFTPGDSDWRSPSSSSWRGPVMASHQPGDETWREGGLERLTRLRAAVGEQPKSRRAHAALIRGMITHGRFAMALEAARQFVELDPDQSVALQLLAYAAAANGDGALATRTLSSEVEVRPGDAPLQRRAAKALEARGDERRACAHWRAAAQLDPRSEASRYEALRCRARVDGERDAALAQASASTEPSKRIDELVAQLTLGASPAHDGRSGRVGWFEAKLRCSAAHCPAVVVVAPDGTVYSPWTPAEARSDGHSVALTRRRGGTYRTLVVGPPTAGAAELQLVADDAARKFPVDQQRVDGPVTVAVTHVQSYGRGWGRRF